jgi:hypothetical protein
LITGELHIIYLAVSILLVANLLVMTLFAIFGKIQDGQIKESIRSIIFELDRFADCMENGEKRRTAIQQINDILGWRPYPGTLCAHWLDH